MSVLLSEPSEVGGGVFTTYSDDIPVPHKLGRGDGVLFHSERVHHVTTVTSGVRYSLVVELWDAMHGDNRRDRHG